MYRVGATQTCLWEKIEMKNEKNEKNHHSSAEKFYFIEVSTYNTITTEEDFPPHYFAVSSTIGINPIKWIEWNEFNQVDESMFSLLLLLH